LHFVARCSCSLLSSQRTGGGRPRHAEPPTRHGGLGGEATCGLESSHARRLETGGVRAAPSQRNSDAGADALAPRWCLDGPVPPRLDDSRGALALADPGVGGATSAPTGQ